MVAAYVGAALRGKPTALPGARDREGGRLDRQFGFRQPIVVDETGVVIVGHTRLLAAAKLGLASVPVHVAATSPPPRRQAYRLADNRTAEETSWDPELLPLEIAELACARLRPRPAGLRSRRAGRLLRPAEPALTDPDDVPEVPAEPVSQARRPLDLGQPPPALR